MNSIRRSIARLLLATLDLGTFIFGTIFQSPTTGEVPLGGERMSAPVALLTDALRNCYGLASFAVKLGGPTFRVRGTVVNRESGSFFVPGLWWIERGAVEQRLVL